MRKRYLLLLVTVLFGLAFLAVDRYTRDITGESSELTVREADYYGEVLFSRRYEDDGTLADTFYAATSKHFPDGDLTVFTEPHLLVSGQNDWVLTADEGVMQGNSQRLKLSGNILIRPVDTNDPTRLETSRLTYHIDQKLAETDELVTMTGEHSRMTGTGMLLDATRQRLELKTGVRTTYEPVK
ncbi:MAG: LPS export ABC transporter periplasmic protein LptC [Pseudomonadota bacterium]|nr:LPS export ABC transporter periplasmic protein LptC [Pseudomonadota bacterium]